MSPGYNTSCPSGTPELSVTHKIRETTLHIYKQDRNINVCVLQINKILRGNSQANCISGMHLAAFMSPATILPALRV